MRIFFSLVLGLFISTVSFGQIEDPVKWNFEVVSISDNEVDLVITAEIEESWHLYSQYVEGPIPTTFTFFDNKSLEFIDGVVESTPLEDYDKSFDTILKYFEEKAEFRQRIKLLSDSVSIVKGEFEFMVCNNGMCLPPEWVDIKVELPAASKASKPSSSSSSAHGLWGIFFLAFLSGFVALLTPCVFPMIPLTVSFFTKQSKNKKKGVFNAVLYGVFIVFIYILLSLPFHFIDSLNPEILNTLATNVILNLIFFGVFVFFAFSFFGFYELTLPTRWGNKTDQGTSFKGGIGIFFMALTLAIVSFSCTGPILGTLLAGSLTADGGAMQLSAGMLGFGVALGFPFGLFALFPNALNALPKSGGWMTTFKVFLGFLELALALKFLSNADLVAHWDLLKREVFIGIWALISLLLTLYLFGVISFKHEVKQKPSILRLIVATLSLLFTAFLVYGLFSDKNELKILSGFPPPEFYSISSKESDCPLGLNCYKDYSSGMAMAKATNKPILLDFTGWACVNCRKMEENVWSDSEIFSLLNENYIIISLYVDDGKELSKDAQFNYQYPDGRIKVINTVGKKWATFQAINFKTASQPYYVQMMSDGKILNSAIQYTDAPTFKAWLKKGLKNSNKELPKAKYLTF